MNISIFDPQYPTLISLLQNCSINRFSNVESLKPRRPRRSLVGGLLEVLPHPAVIKCRPQSAKRERRTVGDVVNRTDQQHAFVTFAAANVDLTTALRIPDLHPLAGNFVDVIYATSTSPACTLPVFQNTQPRSARRIELLPANAPPAT